MMLGSKDQQQRISSSKAGLNPAKLDGEEELLQNAAADAPNPVGVEATVV